MSEALTATHSSIEALDHAHTALKILEDLSAAEPTNVVYHRNTRLCYESFAEAHARWISDEKQSRLQRVKNWTEARSWYEKGSQLFSGLRDRGTLMPVDATIRDEGRSI